jgi:hypothetical protein
VANVSGAMMMRMCWKVPSMIRVNDRLP